MNNPTQSKKVLVIHPEDPSTEFLTSIYENIPNKTVITKGLYPHEITHAIIDHDQVIMLGHGTPRGLMSIGQFPETGGYVINESHSRFLSQKEDNIYIWCYASDYVKTHNLKGFASGMFISEAMEAYACGLSSYTHQEVKDQNNFFSELVGKVIDRPAKAIYDFVSEEYGELALYSEVADYNHKRLHFS